jgi:hypothetical protein
MIVGEGQGQKSLPSPTPPPNPLSCRISRAIGPDLSG